MGDVVVVDFVGKIKNENGELEEFQGGAASDFQVELDEGRFIPGFVEGIAGMNLDETRDLEVDFPEDYSQEELAGQPAVFSITLKEIKEKELPDLDDDFAQEISEFETIEELKNSLQERYEEEAAAKTRANKHNALLDALVENLEAEIPETLLQKEVDFILQQSLMQLSRQGIDVSKILTQDMVAGMRERTRPDAVERLRRTLALGEVAKQEEIKVDEEALQEKIDETMKAVEDPSQIDPDRLREVLHEEMLQEKILDWLETESTVELVPAGTLKKEEAEPEAAEVEETEAETPAAEATVEVEAKATEPEDSEEE
jgi:trigger factor